MAASGKSPIVVTGGDTWKSAVEPYGKNPRCGVKVGAMQGTSYALGPLTGTSVAANLARHEFGTSEVPARRPLRGTAEKKGGEWVKQCVDAIRAYHGQMVPAFNAVGMKMAKDIQQAFEDGLQPPLSQKSIDRKRKMGYSEHAEKPVIMTGGAEQSIEHQWVEDLGSL